VERAGVPQATFACATCGRVAMTVLLEGGGIRTDCGSYSIWMQVAPESVLGANRAADAASLFAIDLELVPLFCASCRVSYCLDHWDTWEVRDPDVEYFWLEEVRGVCPKGHERMIHD
jgi:hypothetical protein